MWIQLQNKDLINLDSMSVIFIEEVEDEEDDDVAYSVTMNPIDMEALMIYPVYFTGTLEECGKALEYLRGLVSSQKYRVENFLGNGGE